MLKNDVVVLEILKTTAVNLTYKFFLQLYTCTLPYLSDMWHLKIKGMSDIIYSKYNLKPWPASVIGTSQ